MQKYRSRRNRRDTNTSVMEGKLFIQLLICAAIVCSFMFLKDTSLPNGKTPEQYVRHFLVTTVKLNDIIAKFKENVVPVSGNNIDEATPAPSVTPAITPTAAPTAAPTPAGT